jgi:hypothetical protein
MVLLALAEIEVRCRRSAERLAQKLFATFAAQIEAARLIRVVFGQLTVGLEFVEALENFVNVSQMIAVFVDSPALGRRGVHFHSYHVARVVLGIELALAYVATVVNHLAIILS